MIPEGDDAIHIRAPWSPSQSLCGQAAPRNQREFDERWNDFDVGGAGCWTCLDARRWIEDYRTQEATAVA